LPSLIQSTLILAFARITNFALLFFSPILLVRLLDPTVFGQYREFVAWSMITTIIAGFSITSNLLYFVPRHPENTVKYVSHTNWLTLLMSLLTCAILWSFREQIHASASFELVLPLAAYVLLFINVSFLDAYWIATRQPKYVFYYTTLRTVVRLLAVVGAAWVTRSLEAIIVALLTAEALRVLVVLLITRAIGLLSFRLDRHTLADQLRFVLPIGLGSSLVHLHQWIGQLAVSTQLGVVALATYAVASYNVPITKIARGAVGDAIFPDMVRQAAANAADGLKLWKRANIGYACLILPTFALLFWYADVLIPLVFTEQYAGAVPIFRVLLLVLPIETLELNAPLRAIKRTGDMLAGNVLLLGTNLACIAAFFTWLPELAIFGPAVGIVAGYFVQLVFLAWRVCRWYGVGFPEVIKWRSHAALWTCTVGSGLVLAAGEYVPLPDVARMLLFGAGYAAVYLWALRLFRLEEVEILFGKLRRRLTRAPAL